ncbi:hypothetical protein [Flavobacterium hauense]
MRNTSSKLRLLPLIMVLFYAVVNSLFDLSSEVKLAFLALLLAMSFSVVYYLYKLKQISKQRLVIFIIMVGISIALTVGMYLYTMQL